MRLIQVVDILSENLKCGNTSRTINLLNWVVKLWRVAKLKSVAKLRRVAKLMRVAKLRRVAKR
jgi:hypothetical protein